MNNLKGKIVLNYILNIKKIKPKNNINQGEKFASKTRKY